MFPRSAVGSVTGIGGMAGSVGGILLRRLRGLHSADDSIATPACSPSPPAPILLALLVIVTAGPWPKESGDCLHEPLLRTRKRGRRSHAAPERAADGIAWASWGRATRCWPCRPTRAANIPAPASSPATHGSTTATSLRRCCLPSARIRPCAPIRLRTCLARVPQELFRVHNWRTDIETLGEIPAAYIREQSEGKLDYAWPAQVNRLISQGGFDLILSIGQVVPHEVIGMANYTKNILIGTGGREGINRSHYLGAVYGMERIMGRAENPGAQRAQPRIGPLPPPPAHRLRAHRGGAQARRRTGRARPLHRRRSGVLPARRRAEPQGQLRDGRRAHPKGRRLSRSQRVSLHLDRQQGRLPHAHGAGRRCRADHPRARRARVRRRQGHRRADPQIWLSRHAGHAQGRGSKIPIWPRI